MNLLEELAGLCEGSVSIYSLDSPPSITNEEKQQPLFFSVFANHKTIITKENKSIEKIRNWTPTNDEEVKEKKLLKFLLTVSNKITKIFYHFWVHFEEHTKNRKKDRLLIKVELGVEKLETFMVLKNTKNSQNFMIDEAFEAIKRNCSKKCAVELLEKTISNVMIKHKVRLLKIMNELHKTFIYLNLFYSTCESLERKKLIHSFYQIKSNYQIFAKNTSQRICDRNDESIFILQKTQLKANQFLHLDVLASNPIKIENKKYRSINKISLDEKEILLKEKRETSSMSLCYSLADSVYESFPETYDNVLFFEKPCSEEKEAKISELNRKTFTEETIEERLRKTRESLSKPKDGFAQYHIPKNEINYLLMQEATKIEYEVPKEKIFSKFSNIFNFHESRIGNLEKKLFGSTEKKESKYGTEGNAWISDRESFAEILSSFKSQSISLRNSRKKLEVEKNKEKIVNQEEECKNSEKIRQKGSLTKVKKSSIDIKHSKEGNLGSTFNEKLTEIKKKDKIKVSLKCKTIKSEVINRKSPTMNQPECKTTEKENKSKCKIGDN